MTQKLPRTSELLQKIKHHDDGDITLGEVVEILREGGFALLLIVFSIPTALPLPAVGVATVLAIPTLFISFQLTLGLRSLWLPKKIAEKKIKMKNIKKAVDLVMPWLLKLEHFLKPRIFFLSTSLGHKVIGFVCLFFAFLVALPFPFTNTIPSMGIVIMSIGLLERDGFAIIGGMVVGGIGVCLVTAIYVLGLGSLIESLLEKIF